MALRVRKVEGEKGQLICAQLQFLVLVCLLGHLEVVESKKNFLQDCVKSDQTFLQLCISESTDVSAE